MDDILRDAQQRISLRREARENETKRCADIAMEFLEGAVMSKYATRAECEAARSMAKAIHAAMTLDEKANHSMRRK